jgi:hypothetical protein
VPLASLEAWKDTGHLIQIQRLAELVSRFNRFVSLVERPEIALTDRQLGVYVCRYTLFNRSGTLTLNDRHLVLEFPGDPYYWLFAASETRFFLRTDETEIEFQKDASGKVVEMIIHNSDGRRGPVPALHARVKSEFEYEDVQLRDLFSEGRFG